MNEDVKVLTLDQLTKGTTESATHEVSIEDLNSMVNENKTIEVKDEVKITDSVQVEEKQEVKEESKTEEVKVEEKKEDNGHFLIDRIDLIHDHEDEDDDISDIERKKKLSLIKQLVTDTIKPYSEKIDLAQYTVEKPKALFDLIDVKDYKADVADWALPGLGQAISMYQYNGTEIDKLDIRNSNRNETNATRDAYKLMYDHITNADKPPFEEFMKIVPYSDVNHLFYNAFRASFEENVYFMYECRECGNIFLEKRDINDTIKFKNDKVKESFNKLFEYVGPFVKSEVKVIRVQANDQIAIDIKIPSIFDVVIEQGAIPADIRRDREELSNMIQYLGNAYFINKEAKSLVPIDMVVEKSLTDTVSKKILQYEKIFKILTSDQYNLLASNIALVRNSILEPEVSFVIPGIECPKCKNKIDEVDTSGAELLFTRHQLELVQAL